MPSYVTQDNTRCYAVWLMELKLVPLEVPEGGNLILGQTHFIKTVEDVYEAIVNRPANEVWCCI